MEKIYYFCICLISGIVIKLYDDLNDNDLFEYFGINKYKEKINELLKLLTTITLVLIFIKYPYTYFYMLFGVLLQYMIDKSHPYGDNYESQLVFAYLILLPLIIIKILKQYNYLLNILLKYIFIIIPTFVLVISDLYFIHEEFSKRKIIYRSILLLLLTCVFIYFNNKIDALQYPILLPIGYYITSIIFQMFLFKRQNL